MDAVKTSYYFLVVTFLLLFLLSFFHRSDLNQCTTHTMKRHHNTHEDSSDSNSNKKGKSKRVMLTGWGKNDNQKSTTEDRLKNMRHVKTKGDWRRDCKIRIKYATAYVKWFHTPTTRVHTLSTPVPVGMTGLFQKLQSAQNRSFTGLPTSVKQYFRLDVDADYKPTEFTITVSFTSDEIYDEFWYIYCRICQTKNSLKKTYWDIYPNKLPNDVDIKSLMAHWDELDLSWNNQDVLGCILPNDPDQSVIINARFILRPEKHWHSVQEKKSTRTQKSLLSSYFTKATAASSTNALASAATATASSTLSATDVPDPSGVEVDEKPPKVKSPKVNYQCKKNGATTAN